MRIETQIKIKQIIYAVVGGVVVFWACGTWFLNYQKVEADKKVNELTLKYSITVGQLEEVQAKAELLKVNAQ